MFNVEAKPLLTGLVIGESPRWHEGRLWFANWGTREILAVDLEGDAGGFEADEEVKAGYSMAEFLVGIRFMLLPGVRY